MRLRGASLRFPVRAGLAVDSLLYKPSGRLRSFLKGSGRSNNESESTKSLGF